MAARNRINAALALVLVTCLAASAAVFLRQDGAPRHLEESQSSSTYAGPIVGIDIGATTSRVGISRSGTIEIVAIVPSYLYFSEEAPDTPLIGAAAKTRAATHPKQTVYGFKALLGRRYDDPEVQRLKKNVPYDIIDGGDGLPYVSIQLGGPGPDAPDNNAPPPPTLLLQFSPEELMAMLVKKLLRKAAEAAAGERVCQATLAVPSHFDYWHQDRLLGRTARASQMAGLQYPSALDAPKAAVLAHGLQCDPNDRRAILVLDVGGRSTSASIILRRGPYWGLDVEGVSTDEGLGGGSFDRRVADYFAELIRERSGGGSGGTSKPEDDPVLMDRLLREAERAKRALSARREVRVEIRAGGGEGEGEGGKGGGDGAARPRLLLNETLTRAKFEELNADLFDKVLDQVHKAQLRLADMLREQANMGSNTPDERDPTIGRVVLAGGSAQIPKLRALVREFFAAGGGDAFRAESIGSGGGGSAGKTGGRKTAARHCDGGERATNATVAFYVGSGAGEGEGDDEGDGGEAVVRGAVVRAQASHGSYNLEDLGCCLDEDMKPCPDWFAELEAAAAAEEVAAAEEAAAAEAAAALALGSVLNGTGTAAPPLVQA